LKKNNAKVSQRGLKRDANNKKRLVRAKKKREWSHMVAQVKFMQDYLKKQQEANGKTESVQEEQV
jgi:hypothetical protein